MTEPDRRTLLEAVSQPAVEVENPARVRYREWMEGYFRKSSEDPYSVGAVVLNGKVFGFNPGTNGVEDLMHDAYLGAVTKKDKPQFKGAVLDLFSQALLPEDIDLERIDQLSYLISRLDINEAAGVAVDAVVNYSGDPRADLDIKLSNIVWNLAYHSGQTENGEIAREAAERLMDSEQFNEVAILTFFESLFHSSPSSAGELIDKYGDRVLVFRQQDRGSVFARNVRRRLDLMLETLKDSNVELSPEQLAVLQV
jgi:hypothetical protein